MLLKTAFWYREYIKIYIKDIYKREKILFFKYRASSALQITNNK